MAVIIKITIFWDNMPCSLVHKCDILGAGDSSWNIGTYLPEYKASNPGSQLQSSYFHDIISRIGHSKFEFPVQ
jgi:hypothetical protein